MNPPATTDPSLGLREIKPAIEIPAPPGWPLWATLALTALAIAIVIFGWWLMRRPRTSTIPIPSEIALAELEALRKAGSGPEAYAMAVSDILRRYIQKRFHIEASRQTSEEFLETITTSQPAPIDTAHQNALRRFLNRCDEVKFARGDLDQEQRQRLHDVAHSFLQTSAAQASPEIPAPPGLQPSLQD